jgi:predicted nucleotidyltransferase component of viral defense system
MLSLQTVCPDTLELLRTLMQSPILSDMRLVGGTSLALQYGHRRSVDLDFFGTTTSDIDELTETLRECAGEITLLSASKTIRVYNIRGVKVDVVNYAYPWIDEPVKEDGLILASPKDIAAMKVNAVIGRGTKKDFIDIFFLLQHYSFENLMDFYLKKYTDGSEYRAMLSMTYFGDADLQPMPYMLEDVSWERIKENISKAVEGYNQKHG